MRAPRDHHGKAGFTLLEVLVAVGVLAVGVVGTLSVLATSLQAARRAAHLEEAVRIARNEMELAVGEGMTQLRPRNDTKGRYTWSLSYGEKPGGLVLADVAVRWMESGELQTYRLSQVFVFGR